MNTKNNFKTFNDFIISYFNLDSNFQVFYFNLYEIALCRNKNKETEIISFNITPDIYRPYISFSYSTDYHKKVTGQSYKKFIKKTNDTLIKLNVRGLKKERIIQLNENISISKKRTNIFSVKKSISYKIDKIYLFEDDYEKQSFLKYIQSKSQNISILFFFQCVLIACGYQKKYFEKHNKEISPIEAITLFYESNSDDFLNYIDSFFYTKDKVVQIDSVFDYILKNIKIY